MAKSSRLQSPSIRVGNAHRTIPFKTLVFDFVALHGLRRAEWTLRVARSSVCLTSSSPIPSRHVSELVRASHFVQLFNCQDPEPGRLRTGPAAGPQAIGLSRPDSKSSIGARGLHRLLRPRGSRRAASTMIDRNRRGTRPTTYSRKEVIQPQVPLRLPCYDFTPVTSHSLGGYLRSWRTDF